MTKHQDRVFVFLATAVLTMAVAAVLSVQITAVPAGSPQPQQPGAQISGGGQSIEGTGITQGPPDAGPVASCKLGKMALASDKDGLEKQIQDMQAKVGGDQEALRRLRLENRASDYKEWSDLTKEAKDDLEKQRWDSALDTLFNGASVSVQVWGNSRRLLDPYNAAYAIDKLQKFDTMPAVGSAASRLEALLARLSGTMVGKEEAEALLDNSSKAIDAGKLAWRLPGDFSQFSPDDWGEGLSTVGGWLLKSPEAIALAKVSQFLISGGYDALTYYYSSQNVNALDQLTGEQLKIVNMWKDRLVSDVSCLNDARTALAKLETPPPSVAKQDPRSGGDHTLLWVLGGSAVGGAALIGAAEAMQNNSSSGGLLHGHCDGTSPQNACGSCTCTSGNCNPSSQCGGGDCWTSSSVPPFCGG